MLSAVVSALASSLFYALASVLQHRAAIAQPAERSMRLGLLGRLLKNPLWLLGLAFDGVAYALQFFALGHGSLVLVQPLLVCGLLFALPLGAWLAHSRMSSQDWWGAAALTVGLSTFLLTASPGAGHAEVSDRDWLILFAITAAVIAPMVLASRSGSPRRRAALLAAAAAINYAVTAALTKAVAHLLAGGLTEALESWELYVLVAAGMLGMLMAQSAFQAGALDASLPVLTVVDPVVSVAIGAFVFGEGIRTGLLASPLEMVGLVMMVVGVVALSKAEVVREIHDEKAEAG